MRYPTGPAAAMTLLVVLAGLLPDAASGQLRDGQFPAESNLKAGVAKVEITPENVKGTFASGHRRELQGVRDPLRAGVLLLDDGATRVAIVTLDTLFPWNDLVPLARQQISVAADVPPKNIMVTASHNHSGPAFSPDSDWGKQLVRQLGTAASTAAADMRTVTIGYGEGEISFNINRRKVINGRAVVRLNEDGPVDRRVKVLRFDDGKSLTPLAVVMHAVCHPCFFTWGDNGTRPYPNGYPLMSADFPGEAQTFVEMCYQNQTSALFLQGCAGDIRPNLPGFPYRCADEADIQWAGRDLGGAVVKALAQGVTREQLGQRAGYYPIRVANAEIELPGKQKKLTAELQAIKVGPYLFLTIPGEPMVEYGFRLEKAIADRAIPIIVGYANGNLGYIATAEAHTVGGYEPTMSPLLPEAETILLDELGILADKVVGDVFATFSKHPGDVKKRKKQEDERKAATATSGQD
ncbi:MAG: hypothetical protein KDA79_11480 [Planctomycetaceae bacterium]|nr:hypothetical protein [Planctomycetaceae bacterium]